MYVIICLCDFQNNILVIKHDNFSVMELLSGSILWAVRAGGPDVVGIKILRNNKSTLCSFVCWGIIGSYHATLSITLNPLKSMEGGLSFRGTFIPFTPVSSYEYGPAWQLQQYDNITKNLAFSAFERQLSSKIDI